ncbi:uncharacterized protein LOC116847140 isoform X1 [Odontomachus brunneus]|uniref:uncharacterized protein LOC116847140 isoform X1 n=1 Tax=Odontomachus brunneus TaxID=486640 RepID=UPI0013F2AD5B|nr:uncharacterized protein LOC116847140 isoform X1 [Odontomachus brunneus]
MQNRKRIQARNNILKAVAGVVWGAHPRNLLVAYKALVRSFLDYGSIIFQDVRRSYTPIFDKLQYAALKVVLGLMSSIPGNVVLHLAGETTLHARRRYLLSKYFSKALSSSIHPLRSKAELYVERGRRVGYSPQCHFQERLVRIYLETREGMLVAAQPGYLAHSLAVRFYQASALIRALLVSRVKPHLHN